MIKHLAFKVVLDEVVGVRCSALEGLGRRRDQSYGGFFCQIGQGCLCFYFNVLDAMWLSILMLLIDCSCLTHSFGLNSHIALEAGR
jgi:hypothetical protein